MNPSSTSELELGTEEHPYKHFHKAAVEVFNYIDPGVEVQIYLKAGETHYVTYKE